MRQGIVDLHAGGLTDGPPRRALGRSGLQVCELGLGAATLGNLRRPLSDVEARETLETALAAGINYVDCAPYYGFGLSEAYARRMSRRKIFATNARRGLRALAELRANRQIGAFGIGVNEVSICLDPMQETQLDVILLAGRYTACCETMPPCPCRKRSSAPYKASP